MKKQGRYSKSFMEASKARWAGNTKRQASSSEVVDLRQENEQLKQLVTELTLKNQMLKKWDRLSEREGRVMRCS